VAAAAHLLDHPLAASKRGGRLDGDRFFGCQLRYGGARKWLYAIFGTVSGGTLYVEGFNQGSSRMSGNTLSASITEYDATASRTGTIDATVFAGASINGTATNSAGTKKVTFSATPVSIASTGYNYNATPVTAKLIGDWSGTLLDGSAGLVSISSAGAISGTNGGCSFTGNAVPRSSGKNVFNMALTFGPSPCTTPGKNVSGIALDYPLDNGNHQLLAFLQDSTKAQGFLFFAQRYADTSGSGRMHFSLAHAHRIQRGGHAT